MKYSPEKHHRQSVRLKGHDYAGAGSYYLTICTHEGQFLFGEIVESQMRPSTTGVIAHKCWNEIPRHFPRATLDVSIVMPNHLHGIIVIGEGTPSERTDTPWRLPTGERREAFGKPVPGSLATIMRLFKQAVTIQARAHVGARQGVPVRVWQDNFYEHIIRSEDEVNRIRQYICNNPLRWPYDAENPARREDAFDDIEDILGTGDDPER